MVFWLKKKTGLQAEDKLQFIHIEANYWGIIDSVEEARKLIVEATEFVIHFLNTEKMLRPYLLEYPYDPNNIRFGDYFR